MTANQRIALLRYSVRRCYQSSGPVRRCRCRCRGQYHGKEHPREWLDAQALALREEEQTRQGQEQLPGMAP